METTGKMELPWNGRRTDWMVGKEIILRVDVASLRCLLGIQLDVQEAVNIYVWTQGDVQVRHIH